MAYDPGHRTVGSLEAKGNQGKDSGKKKLPLYIFLREKRRTTQAKEAERGRQEAKSDRAKAAEAKAEEEELQKPQEEEVRELQRRQLHWDFHQQRETQKFLPVVLWNKYWSRCGKRQHQNNSNLTTHPA